MPKALIALSTFVTLLSSPASAQVEQTVEGAQQFLAAVAAQGSLTVSVRDKIGQRERWPGTNRGWVSLDYDQAFDAYWCKYGQSPRGSITTCNQTYSLGPQTVREINPGEFCVFRLRYSKKDYIEPATNPPKSKDGRFVVTETEKSVPWHLVSNVRAQSSAVHFDIYDGSQARWTYRFNLSAPDMANRVAYAMEFLRVYCDPTAGTGF